VVAFNDAVSNAGFAHDWYARFRERSNVAVDGADARLEFICNIFGAGYSAPLQMNEDRHESIDAVHSS
jgi:hypothetical protein